MRGRLLSACLAIGLIGIMFGTATTAQIEPLFGPPPLPVARSGDIMATTLPNPLAAIDTDQPISVAASPRLPAPLESGEMAPPPASPKPPAPVDFDQPATTPPVRPFPEPSPSGDVPVEDTGRQMAAEPVDDPGYAQPGQGDLPAARKTPPESSYAEVIACEDPGCFSCRGGVASVKTRMLPAPAVSVLRGPFLRFVGWTRWESGSAAGSTRE